MERQPKKFPKVYENEFKEVFKKNRKYDSFYDEYKRVVVFGNSFSIINYDDKSEFDDVILRLLKNSGFLIEKSDMFKGNIIKNKREIESLKIINYSIGDIYLFESQQYIENFETRIKIHIVKKILSKKYKVEVVQYFKKETPFYGLKDYALKKILKKRSLRNMAMIYLAFSNKNLVDETKEPSWVKKNKKLIS